MKNAVREQEERLEAALSSNKTYPLLNQMIESVYSKKTNLSNSKSPLLPAQIVKCIKWLK